MATIEAGRTDRPKDSKATKKDREKKSSRKQIWVVLSIQALTIHNTIVQKNNLYYNTILKSFVLCIDNTKVAKYCLLVFKYIF